MLSCTCDSEEGDVAVIVFQGWEVGKVGKSGAVVRVVFFFPIVLCLLFSAGEGKAKLTERAEVVGDKGPRLLGCGCSSYILLVGCMCMQVSRRRRGLR